jgi:hypothetical protein
MLISSNSLSTEDSRQRRKAAEEHARAERVAKDSATQEGAIRQAGEVPQAEEVDRFRALMQSRGEPRTASRAQVPTGQEAQVPKRPGESMQTASMRLPADAQGVAERFRAAMLAAFDNTSAVPAAPSKDEGGTQPQQSMHAAEGGEVPGPHQDAAPGQAEAGQRTQPQMETAPRREAPRDSALLQNKALPADGNKQDGRGDPVRDAKKETLSPQQIAHKVSHGDTEATQAVRAAHADKDLDDKNGNDASSALMTGNGAPSMPPTEGVAQPAAQPQMQPDAPQQIPQTASFAPALSELLQKHVRQMLVTDPRSARGGRSREVLLRMQNDALPGTDLWLTRTDSGWSLRAEVSSRDAYDTLLEFQDELVKRFADSRLGELSIEPIFHGPAELGGSDRGRNAVLRGS